MLPTTWGTGHSLKKNMVVLYISSHNQMNKNVILDT